MALNLVKVVQQYLMKSASQRFTASEIAKWIYANHPNECQEKLDRSDKIESEAELLLQIQREISAQMPRLQTKHPQLKATEGRPRKYYYTVQTEAEEVEAAESIQSDSAAASNKITEKDLYPKLAEYLWHDFSLYTKRIDERRSSNNRGPNGNRWLYPDLVAMQDLSAGWHQEVKACVREYADKRTKLWSFEVKLLINNSNVRESFFQTVSNSAWANLGYLVAAEIVGAYTLGELGMLCASHGIGVIRLDLKNTAESQILIPAKERTEIDWDIANRLAVENRDFMDFIKLVRQFYQTGNLRAGDWGFRAD